MAFVSRDFPQLDWNADVVEACRQLVRLAVREDLGGRKDYTTDLLISPERLGSAPLIARDSGVVAGLPTIPIVLAEMKVEVQWRPQCDDKDQIPANTTLGILEGAAAGILTAERIILNFLGSLSGIATLTNQFVRQIAGTKARIYDTRKTTPGWRLLEKYAVRCGGGFNHRLGLYDAILVKDNHLAILAGEGMSPAMTAIRAKLASAMKPAAGSGNPLLLEIEVDRLDDLEAVLRAGPDIILLDNMTPTQLREAVACRDRVAPKIELEASGGVTLDTVRGIAEAGVDRISVGTLTHSAASLDVSLDWAQS